MSASEERYPLRWPDGWRRTSRPVRSAFGDWSLYRARQFLEAELRRLGATSVVLSSNIPLRLDGLPYSNTREPSDHGVAVYFRIKGEPRVLAADRWNTVAHNIVALGKHVEAIRGQLRWGVGSLEQAFGGYLALPSMPPPKTWWEILGCSEDAPQEEIDRCRVQLLQKHHPDKGGQASVAAEINAAYDEVTALRGMQS